MNTESKCFCTDTTENPIRFSLTQLLIAVSLSVTGHAQTITLTSDASMLATALGPGSPTFMVESNLDIVNINGFVFTNVDVGSFGTDTPVPPGAPQGTEVVNIPPADGENGFFMVTFILPTYFTNIQLSGSANVDDIGRVFLNGTPISPSVFSSDPERVTEFGNATFATQDASLFQPGQNVILISDANTGGGPSGCAFFATVTFSNTFSITGIETEGHDILLTWIVPVGKTNFVQASDSPSGSNFIDISPPIVSLGSGIVTTNFSDVGAVTNASNCHRIRLVP